MKLALLLASTAATLVLAAFGLPLIAFTDAPGDASAEQVRRLESQARITTSIPPLATQTVAATSTGPTPDHVVGVVVFRTLFGIESARLTIGERSGDYEWRREREAAAWGGFLLAEAALLGALSWRLWTMP